MPPHTRFVPAGMMYDHDHAIEGVTDNLGGANVARHIHIFTLGPQQGFIQGIEHYYDRRLVGLRADRLHKLGVVMDKTGAAFNKLKIRTGRNSVVSSESFRALAISMSALECAVYDQALLNGPVKIFPSVGNVEHGIEHEK